MIFLPALALPAAAIHAQGEDRQQPQQQRAAKETDLRNWNTEQLYRNGWSADEMIGTEVRGSNNEQIGEVKDIFVGRDGRIRRVVVEVGGVLEIGDQHIGVPWKDVQIGRDMQWVQVPLKEVEDGTFSLFGRIPTGEDVAVPAGAWRVNELIGDYASLRDVPRYGMVTDVVFSNQGEAKGVIIRRTAGTWGAAGWYGYPYHGYYPGAYAHPLPYESADVGDFGRFNYVEFAQRSDLAGRQPQQAKRARQDGSAAAGGSGKKE
ncbi:MAG TPA: PRC-barrel domain-containing protein [Burkholderiales bacterium]